MANRYFWLNIFNNITEVQLFIPLNYSLGINYKALNKRILEL